MCLWENLRLFIYTLKGVAAVKIIKHNNMLDINKAF